MSESPLIGASHLHLPAGPWRSLLDGLCDVLPGVDRATWLARLQQGKVLFQGQPLAVDSPYREGMRVEYFREVVNEREIPFAVEILHHDEHLLVVDKPHFLAVAPAGQWVEQTVLRRLQKQLQLPELVPLHRLDRLTAGVMLLSCQRSSRDAYLSLFRQQRMHKVYEAVAGPLPGLAWPYQAAHCLQPGEPFFRMQAVSGPANAWTTLQVLERGSAYWRYRLQPQTGRKHQLRVQMAALGAPLRHDPLYPQLQAHDVDDFTQPLQLLARSLHFDDPLSGLPRHFLSQRQLLPL
ncbi:pseudouridine synthase [Pseudomonas fluvialis]|jgi:tRNA pseudouridine32 synthase/23S rRNA pseudouridine746 synthase|uniref:pseudouridine synthase n=1 Tax=Pseudomonas fluvialis TaxID=1793966 RepID=UPI00370CE7B4